MSLAAVIALAVMWRVAPPGSPPLYEGYCPSSPYRFAGESPAPAAAGAAYPASTTFAGAELATAETPAQAQVYLTDGTLISPSSGLTLRLTPLQASAAPPSGWSFDSNLYRIEALTSSGASLQPAANHPVTVVLLAATSGAQDTIFRAGSDGSWTQLRTVQFGCAGTFESVSPVFGDFVLLRPGGGAAQSGGAVVVVIVVLLCVVVLVTTAGLLLLRRR